MDYMHERKLNLRDLNLKHIEGEIYLFKGIEVDMTGCGNQQFQMLRHIAEQLAAKLKAIPDIEIKKAIQIHNA